MKHPIAHKASAALLNVFFVFLLFIMNAPLLYAQNEEGELAEVMSGISFKNKRVIPPSPEAASLGKFGNLPVSLFTGTPKVSIPIYELKGNALSTSINMSYNAAGFNPQEIAGWTGLGWTLAGGGVITRSVIGNPDVNINYFNANPSPLVVPTTSDLIVYNDYLENLKKGVTEGQPDLYFFNFPGYSGKFMIKPDGTIMLFEKSNLKIQRIITNGVGSFTVTDPSGNIYQFTHVEVSSSATDDASTEIPHLSFTYESAWYLASITSADGFEQMTFDYYSNTQDHYPYSFAAVNQSTVYTFIVNSGTAPTITFATSGPTIVTVKRKYLQKITLWRNAQQISYVELNSAVDQRQDLGHTPVEFPGERLLTNIKVFSKANDLSFKLLKQYNFNYSYFNSTASDWKYKRLRLDQIQEISASITTPNPPPYIFEYDNSTAPPIGTASIDHWGFYNSLTSYTTTPASYYGSNQVVITATNRIPTLGGSASLMLNKIKYPTGGSTSFEYELNRANVTDMGVIDIGGIRIKRMVDYSADNQKAIEKLYEYTLEDGTTSGQAKYPVYKTVSNFKNYSPNTGGTYYNPCSVPNIFEKQIVTISASSIMGLGSVMGSHIGYKRVVEKQVDIVTGQPLGKTVYEYEMGGSWGELNNEDVKNGELIKQTVYDIGGKMIKSIENQYETKAGGSFMTGPITAINVVANPDQDNLKYLLKVHDSQTNTDFFYWTHTTLSSCIPSNYTVLATGVYKVKSLVNGITYNQDNRKLVQQTIKTYDQASNAYMTNVKKISYNNPEHSLPTLIEQTTNNSEAVITKKKYPLDYSIVVIPPNQGGSMDNATIGIWNLQSKNIVGAEIETYQYRQNTDGSNKRYLGGSLTFYSTTYPYPISLSRIETSQPLTSFQESIITNGVFSNHSSYKPMGSFLYDASGLLVQQTKANDLSASYIWAYGGNLPIAEVTNAPTGSIAYTSFETDEGGGWSSSAGFLTNRNATDGVTGSYSFSLGTGNLSKAGLPSQKYIVSYWRKNGALTILPTPTSTKTGLTIGAFTYYEHLLPVTTSITLTGSSAIIDELRLYPEKAFMSTTAYNYYTGQVSAQCSPANKISRFEYDGLQRLLNIKDEAGNIVKNYQYNYGTVNTTTASPQTLFYSAPAQGVYYKAGCPTGSEAQPYTYSVPYGKYVSVNSQPEANAKATADVQANGQNMANQNGLCYFWNTQQQKRFFRNNCQPWEGSGSAYWYTIPVHTYWSTISVADANDKAWVDINTNGQNAANTYGTCSCSAEGYRFINGVCEQGQISYVGFESAPGCAPGMNYRCYYFYFFSDGYQSPVYSTCSPSACQQF